MIDLPQEECERLVKAAKQIASRAYAPYSKFKVGAAVLTENGKIYTGCNVENASYGLTICAERVAIFSALAHEGAANARIQAMAVVTETGSQCPPCGACRQVIYEFGPDAIVIYQGREGVVKSSLRELLPNGFTNDG